MNTSADTGTGAGTANAAGTGPPTCPNCGDGRPSRFCATCGQNDRNYVRGLVPVVWEFFRESLEVDSRLFRTLKLLLFRPGSLSTEFTANRRAAYMSPVRLYLFASFLFFLVLSTMPGSFFLQAGQGDFEVEFDALADPEEVEDVGDVEDAQEAADVEDAADARGAADIQDPVDAEDWASDRANRARIDALKAAVKPNQRQKVEDLFNRADTTGAAGFARMLAWLVQPPDWVLDAGDDDAVAVGPDAGADSAADAAGPSGEQRRPNAAVRLLLSTGVEFLHDPNLFVQRFVGNLPVAMFLMLPLLALALALCYWKRFFVEHLVFAMHVQTFTFVVLAVALVVPDAGAGMWVQLVLALVQPVYGYVALKRFYGNGWIVTFIKGWIIWWLYFMIVFFGMVATFFMTA